ncbi:hypothetical protein SEPCBS119000_000957 [Sporothrix epigloea]|uniref:Uncharacterized protein n=1 Tax=Sporothrix epigloea TaxID=1892477 RepID=A0ABP0DAY6_9PEZI
MPATVARDDATDAPTVDAGGESSASESGPSMAAIFSQLAMLTSSMATGFAEIKADFVNLNGRLDTLEARLDSLETRTRGCSTPITEYSDPVPQSDPMAKDTSPTALIQRDTRITEEKPAVTGPRPSSQEDERHAAQMLSCANDSPSASENASEHETAVQLTSEFTFYDTRPYTPFSSTQPSERFVQALFPPLQVQDTASQRPTPDDLKPSDIKTPTFSGQNDLQLHQKLIDLQDELRWKRVNFDDWPAYAAAACGTTHHTIREWANVSGCRWHQFVLAIICANGLQQYYHTRDMAFSHFSIARSSTSPEKVLQTICHELKYAPYTHKTISQRALEFQSHLYRLDPAVLDRTDPYIPNGSRQKLLDWAHNATFAAERHWNGVRTSLCAAKSDATPSAPTPLPAAVPAVTAPTAAPPVAKNQAAASFFGTIPPSATLSAPRTTGLFGGN